MKLLQLLLFSSIPLNASADFLPLWDVGEQIGGTYVFSNSQPNGSIDPSPGSANVRDDHFYFAGTYPGIGTVSKENLNRFEAFLTPADPSNQIHFFLTSQQAQNSVFRATINFRNESAPSSPDPVLTVPVSQVRFHFNGQEVFTSKPFTGRVNEDTPITIQLPYGVAQTGANILSVTRIGLTPGSIAQITRFFMEHDPQGATDGDNDNLPKNWELNHGLSDSNSSDTSTDLDGDSLTNLQEFLAGTHPRKADTDGDGINDALETSTDPLLPDTDGDGLIDSVETASNPNQKDSDSDGNSDAWEIATGHSPTNQNDEPTNFRSIGINFSSISDPKRGFWDSSAINGIIPQQNWNQTYPLRSKVIPAGDFRSYPLVRKGNIQSPSPGQLVDASGQVQNSMNFAYNQRTFICDSNFGFGTANTRLLNGVLRPLSFSGTISFNSIPYSSYDAYVYVTAIHRDDTLETPTAQISLPGLSRPAQTISPQVNQPDKDFQLPRPGFISESSSNPDFHPFASVVKFEALSSSSLNIRLTRLSLTCGIAAVQFVDRNADQDNNGLKDYWQFQHGLNPAISGPNDDPDSDGLTNAQEFSRKTNPNLADTDGDGLSDLVETNQGFGTPTLSNSRTDPNDPDTDGDTISDYDELTGFIPSNPIRQDSDNDGVNDLEELRQLTAADDAAFNNIPPGPQIVNSNEFLWELTDLQFIWDHSRTAYNQIWHDRPRPFFADFRSSATGSLFEARLFTEKTGIKYYFKIFRNGGFGSINNSDSNYLREINGDQAVQDFELIQKMGFSGYGSQDFSDPLTYRFHGVRTGPSNRWTFTISIINQKNPGTPIVSHVETDQAAHSNLTNPPSGLTYSLNIEKNTAMTLVRSSTIIEDLPQYAAVKDSDNDGMSDLWESTNGLNDPLGNPDGDGLNNREEFLAGTNPNSADSDGDFVNDDLEIAQFSDPNNSAATPGIFSSIPSLIGDFDGNNMRDSWEAKFGITTQSAQADSDGDGHTNAQESITGTDPFDRNSVARLSIQKSPTLNQVALTWPTLSDKVLIPRIATDLSIPNWNDITTPPGQSGGMSSLNLTALDNAAFYRLEISEKDQDNDGVSDSEEALLGSNPLVANSIQRDIPVNVPYDSNGDGTFDSMRPLPGDYAALISRFKNRNALISGSSAINLTDRDAARLLMQATYGPTLKEISEVKALGIEAWIDDQINNKTPTSHEDYIRENILNIQGDGINNLAEFKRFGFNTTSLTIPFARAAVLNEDQLRQRVAFALSQIFVASFRTDILADKAQGMTSFYDIFVNNAFGNYQDILREVTFHPVMGSYLSHVFNRKTDLELGIFPDENYAREVMQLFSIGLWELNNDGTRKVIPGTAKNIPSYDLQDITEMARVMTGFAYSHTSNPFISRQDLSYTEPMSMRSEFHDFGSKRILKKRFNDGTVGQGILIPDRIPSSANARQDIEDAVRILFEHANTPPFISKALIKLLVTHNPSPEYVEDIALVFIDNGSGTRGDLGAVIKAILMHSEARDPRIAETEPTYGRLRDPAVRFMHLLRLIGMRHYPDFAWWDRDLFAKATSQTPLASPSVFNFYVPSFAPNGPISENNLVAGPFQILDITTSIAGPNYFWTHCLKGVFNPGDNFNNLVGTKFPPNFSEILPYASDSDALLDYLNLVVCGGKMRAVTRKHIKDHLETNPLDDPRQIHHRISIALYGALISPEGAIQR